MANYRQIQRNLAENAFVYVSFYHTVTSDISWTVTESL